MPISFRKNHWFVILVILLLAGCTTIRPESRLRDQKLPRPFDHQAFDRVLEQYVDGAGRVDYAGLKNDPSDLEHYYRQLAYASPDSHPHLFPTEESRLAYWINAYNAAAMRLVVAHYPIDSVSDVDKPWVFFFLPDLSGFFVFQRVVLGGKSMSLYALENEVIRSRFSDPRIHFALNCASKSCPKLPRRAFSGTALQMDLARETILFLAEGRNLRIDHEQQRVYLSTIFDWYRDDFLDWYRRHHADKPASLLNYIAVYAPPEVVDELEAAAGYEVRFIPYDWGLNDQIEFLSK